MNLARAVIIFVMENPAVSERLAAEYKEPGADSGRDGRSRDLPKWRTSGACPSTGAKICNHLNVHCVILTTVKVKASANLDMHLVSGGVCCLRQDYPRADQSVSVIVLSAEWDVSLRFFPLELLFFIVLLPAKEVSSSLQPW